jgi:hypothetical protein
LGKNNDCNYYYKFFHLVSIDKLAFGFNC